MNPDEMENGNGEITASISADVDSIPEGNDGETSTVTYTVSTSAPLDRDARVIVESIGGNNPLVGEPLDIPAGQQSVTFTNEVSGDSIPEENETLTGTLAFAAFNAADGSTGDEIAISQSTANITVVDDDGDGVISSEISIADAAIVEGNEGNTALEFTVSLSEPIEEVATTLYSTSDLFGGAVAGEDYVATNGEITFNPGETSKTISVDIIGDTLDEEDEGFSVGLMNAFPVAIGNSEAIGTITNDDSDTANNTLLSIREDRESVLEGDEGNTTPVTFTVTLEGTPLNRDIVVNANIAQVVGEDPNTTTAQSVNALIPAGQSSGQLTYDLLGDNNIEPDGTITATYNSVSFADDSGNLTQEEVPISLGGVVTGTTRVIDDDDGSNIVYRFFNPTVGVHFYTDDEVEKDFVQDELDNYNFEGSSYRTVDSLSGQAEDVYRFFNSSTGVHLYTTDENERDNIIDNLDDFTFEGSAYSAYETQIEGSIPIYRFYEPTIGVHFYTPSEAERDFVDTELGNYNNEGTAFYALPLEAGDL